MSTKSNPKVKKYLADGTEAKVGMIVKVIAGLHSGNKAGTITKITKLQFSKRNKRLFIFTEPTIPVEARCFCEDVNRVGSAWQDEYDVKITSWVEYLSDLVPATAEERKQYYADLAKA